MFADGSLAQETAVTVNAVRATVPLGGGRTVTGAQGIALDPATGRVYIALNGMIVGCTGETNARFTGANQMSIVDPARNAELAAVPVGSSPVWPTVDSVAQVVYMSNSGDGTVTVHGAATGARQRTIVVGGRPHMGGLDFSTRLMLVGNTVRWRDVVSEQIYATVVDTRTDAIVREFVSGPAPHGVVVDQERDLMYMTSVGDGLINVVNAATGESITSGIPIRAYGTTFGNNNMLARQAATRRLFQVNSQGNALGVVVIDETTLTAERVIAFGSPANFVWGMWVDEPNRLLFAAMPQANAIGVADLDTLKHVATIPVGPCPYAVMVDPARRVGATTNQGSPTVDASSSIFDLCPVYAAVGRTVSGCSTAALPTMSLDRSSLAFGATSNGSAFVATTGTQAIRLSQSGSGSVTWTATSSAPWLTVTPTSGTGAATLSVAVAFHSSVAAPASSSGSIALSFSGAANSPGPVTATLTVMSNGISAAPAGVFDTPVNDTTGLSGSIAVTGWSLDDVEVTRVRIMRDPLAGEGGAAVFIGDATFVDGARPDVAALNSDRPRSTRAGWGYLLLTNFLPNQGNGTLRLHAYADDAEGKTTLLGSKTISVANATATQPFGAIDTPGQGETVSGSVNNFGWVLARGARRADPPSGGTVTVLVDGTAVGTPSGWTSRTDLAALFPQALYSGVTNALAVFPLNTATLSNGVHTLAWVVTDNQGATDGVGSRYFTVSNSSSAAVTEAVVGNSRSALAAGQPLLVRRGFDLDAPFRTFTPDAAGRITIHGEELDRFALQLERGSAAASLPIGSRLDPDTGVFTWNPGVAFVGPYDLVFMEPGGRRDVRIVLHPKGSGRAGAQIVVDTPVREASGEQPFLLAGWAIDTDAGVGSGFDTLHVWAYPVRTVGNRVEPWAVLNRDDPWFVGVADYGGERPDVAAIYGERFLKSGYGLNVSGLAPGEYDLAVFAWSNAKAQFLPAKTVRITVR